MKSRNNRISRRDALRTGACFGGVLAGGCLELGADDSSNGNASNDTSMNGNASNDTSMTDTSNDSSPENETDDGSDDEPPQPNAPVDTSEMTLAFDESFEGEEMDWKRWNTDYPWNSRTHNYNGFASRNNSFLQGDRLILKAEAEPQEGKDYTTGVVSTADDFSTGYIEGRIRVPPPLPGFWPAFWLTPGDYWPPEIDIFEFFGTDPCAKMTYHYWDDEDSEKVEARGEFCDRNFHADFYDYGIDWTEDRIVWYIDGEERFRTEGDHVRSDPLTLIINFGIDSGFLDDPREADLPAYLGVDWVRIWQR